MLQVLWRHHGNPLWLPGRDSAAGQSRREAARPFYLWPSLATQSAMRSRALFRLASELA
jgi:hypothetical protein